MMLNRINIVLALLLMAAALLLVTSQNRARRLNTEMEQAQGQARELDVRFRNCRSRSPDWPSPRCWTPGPARIWG